MFLLNLLNSNFGRSGEIGRRVGLKIQWGQPRVGSSPTSGIGAYVAQSVEHFHGKEGVTGSNPVVGLEVYFFEI